MFTLCAGLPYLLRFCDGEGHMNVSRLKRTLDTEPTCRKDLQHAVVFPKDVSFELGDAIGTGNGCKPFEEQCTNPPTLMLVGNSKCHLSTGARLISIAKAKIAPYTDD